MERFNRILKERMYRVFIANNILNYLWMLLDLVKSYNVLIYRSIGMVFKDVNMFNDWKVWKILYGKRMKK